MLKKFCESIFSVEGFFADNSESYRILEIFDKRFVPFDSDYIALLEHPTLLADSQEFRDAFFEFKAAIQTLPVFA